MASIRREWKFNLDQLVNYGYHCLRINLAEENIFCMVSLKFVHSPYFLILLSSNILSIFGKFVHYYIISCYIDLIVLKVIFVILAHKKLIMFW